MQATRQAAKFSIDYYQCLTPEGELLAPTAFAKDINKLEAVYRLMTLTRLFDTKAIALQRTGQLGTYASSLGQEAVSAGIAYAMAREDVFCASYRDYAVQLSRGVTMEEILAFWGGSEQGNAYKAHTAREDLSNCIPIGSQTLHAAGIATAFKLRHEKRAALVTCGDGATSQGDVYETINIAGAWQLPLVMIVVNNQWAISTPRSVQTAAETLAQKAIAGGIAGEQVDGNDIIAMQERVSIALQKAREGAGATLIEAMTYRLSDHTTADNAARYRPAQELSEAWKQEPIERLRNYLLSQNAWSEEQELELHRECAEKITKAVERYPTVMQEPKENMFVYHYAHLPVNLQKQCEGFLKNLENSK